jgi:uncharacterized protein (DUF433 family)
MPMSTAASSHIRVDKHGVAWIDDTNVKVIEIALEHIAHGASSDEMFDQHGGYLTMAQIHAALTHYYDHQADYDAEIDKQVRELDSMPAQSLDSPGRRRLRALGKLS